MSENIDSRTLEQARIAISTAGANLNADGEHWNIKPDESHRWDSPGIDIPPTATLRVATLGEALDLCALLVALPTAETVAATPKRAPRRMPLAPTALGLPHALVLYQAGKPVAARFYARRRHAEAARTLTSAGQARLRRADGKLPKPSATRPSWAPASTLDYRKTRAEVQTEIVSAPRQSQIEDMLGLPTGNERTAGRVYRLPGCPKGRLVFPIA